MDQETHICDREQCRYLGGPPKGGRWLSALALVLLVHLFPLFRLMFPITMPLTKQRMDNQCPACRRGMIVTLTTPRGRALEARRNRSGRPHYKGIHQIVTSALPDARPS